MVSQQDPNRALLLINKLLGPNSAPPQLPPPPIHTPGPYVQYNTPAAHLPIPPPFPAPAYYQGAGPPPPHPVGILPAPKLSKKSATPEKKDLEALKSKYSDSHKKSRKRRYDDTSRRNSKVTSYDDLIASHGTSSANRKPRSSLNTESQKAMGKQIRAILAQEQKEVLLKPTIDRKDRKKRSKKSRGEKNYNDLSEFLPDESVARKRRKIQDRVRSKRDSAKEETKEESIYDYMHYDPDKELLKKRRERVLSSFQQREEEKITSIDDTLKEIEAETLNETHEPGELIDDDDDKEVEEVFEKPLETKPVETKTAEEKAPIQQPTRVGIRGSLSHPPSPKPSEMEIKQVLEEMEEGELSDDEEEYNKLINDVESAAKTTTTTDQKSVATPEKIKQSSQMDITSPAKTPVKHHDNYKVDPGERNNLNTGNILKTNANTKTIPFLAAQSEKKEGPSILDDLAFLNSIKTKYKTPTVVRKPKENIEDRSKELIEQLLRQDKLSREREKQKRSKERQREKDKREREKAREEKKREKLERIRELEAQIQSGGKVKGNKLAASTTRRLKNEFKNNFIKASNVCFEGTLEKSTIDNSVLDEAKTNSIDEFVDTKEHRFDNGLVIQTSVQKVDGEELLERVKPVRYNFSNVNVEYPEFAVAGAIAYRLREKKQRLIHRVVERIGKAKALELLFKTEEIEKNGGEMTKNGDRRKQPGGVYIGLLKQNCSADDVKYIFAAEDEIESEAHVARKRQSRYAKRKRYAKNKNERNLSNALSNALNFTTKDDGDDDESVISYIPSCDTVKQLSMTQYAKPTPFPLSFVKPTNNKELITIGVTPKENKNAIAKIEAFKKGYSTFVKKGTAAPGDVFKPSCTTHMSAESNIFDELMKKTTDLKNRSDTKDEEGDEMETGEELVKEQPEKDDAGSVEPAQNNSPGTAPGVVAAKELSTDNMARAVSTPQPLQQAPSPAQGLLKPLPKDRVSAIVRATVKPKVSDDMSEGECTDSDDEKMET